jgi:hypothetical protein
MISGAPTPATCSPGRAFIFHKRGSWTMDVKTYLIGIALMGAVWLVSGVVAVQMYIAA